MKHCKSLQAARPLVLIFSILLFSVNAWAAGTCSIMECSSGTQLAYKTDWPGGGITNGTAVCFGMNGSLIGYVGNDSACASGYTLRCNDFTNTKYYLGVKSTCSNTYIFSNICSCEPACTECYDCEDMDWTNFGKGQEIKRTATCDYNTCKCSYNWSARCAEHYYGRSFTSTAQERPTISCTLCPFIDPDNPGYTNHTAVYSRECYAPKNTSFYSDEGIFEFVENCNYDS